METTPYKDAIDHLAAHDPIMYRLITTYPEPTFTKHVKYYDELVSSIISQQLSVKAASTIYQRFCSIFGSKECPSPQHLIGVSEENLRSVGLSRQKISYIKDLAHMVINGSINFESFDKLSNDEIIKELTAVKGIGVWTVHMFLIFCMNRLNVLPVGDLGIRTAVTRLYGFDTLVSPIDVAETAIRGKWSPYESIASWYLWRSLENK